MKKRNVYGGRWAKARLAFLNEHPLCVMCQEQGRITAATVVDHITPHRLKEALESGDKEHIVKAQALFWDAKNFQSFCKLHHNSTKKVLKRVANSLAVMRMAFHSIPIIIGINNTMKYRVGMGKSSNTFTLVHLKVVTSVPKTSPFELMDFMPMWKKKITEE